MTTHLATAPDEIRSIAKEAYIYGDGADENALGVHGRAPLVTIAAG